MWDTRLSSFDAADRDYLVQLNELIGVLRKRWLSAMLVTLAVMATAVAATLMVEPLYSSSARIFFSVQGGSTISDLNQGSNFAENQMASYAEVATSPLVLEPVIDSLGLSMDPGELASTIAVTIPAGTVIMEIRATHPEASSAAEIANAVAEQLSITVGQLSPDQLGDSEPVRATIVTPATPGAAPVSPNVSRNLVLGVALGVLLGVAVALLREALDTKVRSEADLLAVADISVIGSIHFDDKTEAHPIVMHDDPHGQRAEAYRRLRTNLQFLDLADRPNSVVVTSSVPEEGKSTTAANLAVALADAGARVILVDADLRRPSVADYTGIEGRVGLTTVLIGRAELEDVVQPWKSTRLDILPAGQVPPNPSELLGSRAMSALLKRLTDRYDVVVLDTPPLLPVTDAAVLSAEVGGMLVVVGADRIHKAQLRDSLQSLENVGAHVLGLVINKVSKQDADRYGYSYESYRPHEASREAPRARRRTRRRTAPIVARRAR